MILMNIHDAYAYSQSKSVIDRPHLKGSQSESVSCSVVPTLCDRMDCSPPGSSVHGILQARILEWVAIPFCRRSS